MNSVKIYPIGKIINNYFTPDWCSHWPKSYEESGEFGWEKEFNF